MLSPPPRPTLFPYTTLFRSRAFGSWVNRKEQAQALWIVSRRGQPQGFGLTKSLLGRDNYPPRTRDVLDGFNPTRSEEHTSELQSHHDLVCRLLLEKKNIYKN